MNLCEEHGERTKRANEMPLRLRVFVIYEGPSCPFCKTESDLNCMVDKLGDAVQTIANLTEK